MVRKRTALILVCMLVLSFFLTGVPSCAEGTLSDSPKAVIGIAWRADTDSEFYTNVCVALQEAGAEAVLLEMVVDEDLEYEDGRIAGCGVNENDYLTEDYAALVKKNTYRHSNAAEVLRGIDGVIFTGGEDISPTLLAEPKDWHHIEAEKDFNATRDVSDYLLMAYCIDSDIPVMSFCRGMQMLAVVSGASMIQDIPTFYAENGLTYHFGHRNEKASADAYRDYAPHDIWITAADSLSYDIFGEMSVSGVPSWHHQAVGSTEGTKLAVTATALLDGYEIIEAIERTDRSMIIGFQFHPEAAIAKHVSNAENADRFMSMEKALRIFTVFTDHCLVEKYAAAA